MLANTIGAILTPTLIIKNISSLLTMDPKNGHGPMGMIHDGAVAVNKDTICWIGKSDEAPTAHTTIDAAGQIVMPGLIDCHTHTTWAGSRASEFEARLEGANYSDILKEGGGILHTVAATRAASLEQLTQLTADRLRLSLMRGVTTTEIKSGYGLTPLDERKQLKAARMGGDQIGVRVLTTFLGAHTIPAEYRSNRDDYVRQIVEEQLPLVAEWADFIDAYIDTGAFTLAEGERILGAGVALGLVPKVHAEQVAHTGAAELAAKVGAASADHLERLDEKGAVALSNAQVVAVLLPGAMLYLKDTAPPVQLLRDHGVQMAVATDYNPGSSPLADLWTAATLSVLQMGLTVHEALLGITRHAATALKRPDLGILRVGARADIIVVPPPTGEPPEAASLIQFLGPKYPSSIVVGGTLVKTIPQSP